MTPQWAWELARELRRRAGVLDLFPFDLRAAIPMAFSLAVKEMPALTVAKVARRLALEKCVTPREKDRALRACLVARKGAGWVFLDADDPPGEKSFSLAHEVAHFLRHHWQPRRAAAGLGASALRAFDGEAAACEGDRLRAALRGVGLKPYAHLMHRHPDYTLPEVREAEEEADLLAVELLAPEEELKARLRDGGSVDAVLERAFGLPAAVAQAHARRLAAVA